MFLSDSHTTISAGFGTVNPSREVQAAKQMVYSDSVMSKFAPWKYLSEVGAQCRNNIIDVMRLMSPHQWSGQ
jgi:hypothetical protein